MCRCTIKLFSSSNEMREMIFSQQWFALKTTLLYSSFYMVMWNSILTMYFETHWRWIRSDVLSIRRAEKEWMAGRLPVKALRVSTSSLACFCHKMFFGLDLICPAPCTRSADLRATCNIRLGMLPETALLFRCVQPKRLEVDVFLWAFSVLTVSFAENRHVNPSLIPMS